MIKSRVGIYTNTKPSTDTLMINRRRETHFTKGGNNEYICGYLPLEVTEDEVRQEFMAFGEVISVIVMNDKYIGSSQLRGYGFVEMTSKPESEAAITSLKGKRLRDRLINVVETLPLSDNKDKGFLHSRRISRFSGRGRKRRYRIS